MNPGVDEGAMVTSSSQPVRQEEHALSTAKGIPLGIPTPFFLESNMEALLNKIWE
jgi:hypothetical protein